MSARKAAIAVIGVLILVCLNAAIVDRQGIREDGAIVFLELAPVDPRSLMQGDYMRLRFAIENDSSLQADAPRRGGLVIRLDANRVGQLVGPHRGRTLEPDELLLRHRGFRIVPDSFLMQEGHEPLYRDARYGAFRFLGQADYLLVGLADDNRNIIEPRN